CSRRCRRCRSSSRSSRRAEPGMAARPVVDPAAAADAAETTEAVAAAAQSRGEGPAHKRPAPAAASAPLDTTAFSIAPAIDRVPVAPYQRRRSDPLYRPLRIYTIDPSASRLDGAVATIDVPWEPLRPGPAGRLFVVDNRDLALGIPYRCADLDDPHVLLADGYAPSPSDPRFHQQMVYAVC